MTTRTRNWQPSAAVPSAAVQEAEAYLRSLPKAPGAVQLRALVQRDYHTCECEWPYIERKWSAAAGIFTEIRLCCLAKAVEQLTGLRLFEAWEFDPLFEWDCTELVEDKDGTMIQRGAPPRFMRQRMAKRGIPIRNLPSGIDD